ncbi:uncharacterized protein [Henckelia pumila]|uniref:uncharacterized protein n=1 Tax=Henckelia pumila TaxID=405737 RepID=UPI003C6E6184
MGINNTKVMQVKTPLVGFAEETVEAAGELTLPISLGSYPRRTTKMVKLLVVKALLRYNVILGRPTLNLFQAIASTYHMKLKFPTSDGIGEAIEDSRLARECHASILRNSMGIRRQSGPCDNSSKIKKQKLDYDKDGNNIYLIEGESEEQERIEATKTLKYIEIHNVDVFTWGYEALPGIPPKLALHHLNADQRMKPVEQRKRFFGPDKREHIATEVEKLLTMEYIRPISYPEWLANVVLVPKPGGKWRLCIDYTDLNNSCPKDLFLLPYIDILVDSTAGCELLSFLDVYQVHNQIV